MRHKAKLTISRPSYGCGRKKISIMVKDADSRIRFLDIEMDLDKFTQCVTGVSEVDCEMEFRYLHNVGKKKEMMDIEVVIPKCDYNERNDVAFIIAQDKAPEGWIASNYFGSQNSFYTKDGKDYARTTASRWVDKD